MNEEQSNALDRVLEALSFYANANIYRRILSITHKSTEESQIMQDRGELARKALFKFDGIFDVKYERQTEI
jgi:hypothetical protein